MKKLLIFMIGMAIVLAGCGADTSTQSPSYTDQTSVTSDNDADPTVDDVVLEDDEEEMEEVKEEFYGVGDTFELKDWEVTFDSFEFDQSVSANMLSSSADEGNKFLILRMTVLNNGTSADQFISIIGGTSIKALYDEKYEYGITITLIDGDLSNQRVQPLASQSGFTVIEVPDRVVEATESLVINFSLDGEKAKVKIR